MIRMLLLSLLLTALLPLSAGRAAAASLAAGGDLILEARLPSLTLGTATLPLAHGRLVTRELVLLPSGKAVLRTLPVRPVAPLIPATPATEPLILPLPGAMPLFLVALAGLALAGHRRRAVPALAGKGGTA